MAGSRSKSHRCWPVMVAWPKRCWKNWREGVDDEALAAQLQRDGVLAFAKSWGGLLARIRDKSPVAAKAMATEHPQ